MVDPTPPSNPKNLHLTLEDYLTDDNSHKDSEQPYKRKNKPKSENTPSMEDIDSMA